MIQKFANYHLDLPLTNQEVNERYDRWYPVGKQRTFYLCDYYPNSEECKFILLKVLEQAVRDYVNLTRFPNDEDLYLQWLEARDFIFDDSYTIDWGDKELKLSEILDLIDIDIDWFRLKARKKFEEQDGKRGREGIG